MIADKGFLIEKMLTKVEVATIIPPLKRYNLLRLEDTLDDTLKRTALKKQNSVSKNITYEMEQFHLLMTGTVNHSWAVCSIQLSGTFRCFTGQISLNSPQYCFGKNVKWKLKYKLSATQEYCLL